MYRIMGVWHQILPHKFWLWPSANQSLPPMPQDLLFPSIVAWERSIPLKPTFMYPSFYASRKMALLWEHNWMSVKQAWLRIPSCLLVPESLMKFKSKWLFPSFKFVCHLSQPTPTALSPTTPSANLLLCSHSSQLPNYGDLDADEKDFVCQLHSPSRFAFPVLGWRSANRFSVLPSGLCQ